MRRALLLLLLCAPASAGQRTYCNPMNLDYGYTPLREYTEKVPDWMKTEPGRHRATADPVIVPFKGAYYLFSTNQRGYWRSKDLLRWSFLPHSFVTDPTELSDICAPAAFAMRGTLYVLGSAGKPGFPLWSSDRPDKDRWASRPFPVAANDPAFFLDDDGRLYLYWGSSNVFPIFGMELDPGTFEPKGPQHELIRLQDERYGWQRFGEENDNKPMGPFMEGAWMNKRQGRYYLQYAAPGTEFSGYADGVFTSTSPLGPFTHQAFNPFSYKPGGFIRGAGHGATFQDFGGRWWHITTLVIAVKNNFERRVGLFPAAFDEEGTLYADTSFGDYPRSMPEGRFTGWMLLSFKKPVTASSSLSNHPPEHADDESVKTYWSAASGSRGEWLRMDLLKDVAVHAVQVNYADQDAEFLGKQAGLRHQYRLWGSADGKGWKLLVDKSRNKTDVPHDYVELKTPSRLRHLKLENVSVPTGKFAVSGLRVFGRAEGAAPEPPSSLTVVRDSADRRNAMIRWAPVPSAYGYQLRFGLSPDKLYGSIMILGAEEHSFRGMDRDADYHFAVETLAEAGVSPRSGAVRAD